MSGVMSLLLVVMWRHQVLGDAARCALCVSVFAGRSKQTAARSGCSD